MMRAHAKLASLLMFFVLGLTPALLAQASAAKAARGAPTVEEARHFVDRAEKKLLELWANSDRAAWVQATYITDDTEAIAAQAQEAVLAATTDLATEAARFNGLKLPPDVARKLALLKLSLTLPAPPNSKDQSELTRISTSLEADYGKGKYCPPGKECLSLNAMEKVLANSRNPAELREVWLGWHAVGPPMRSRYTRLVELANAGARNLGYKDLGAYWRSKYDMEPAAYEAEVERLWQQVRPLYESLHAYVRAQLAKHYGAQAVPANGLIPAHLLGNMWAQEWSNIYPLVAPANSSQAFDLTQLLKAKNVDALGMVKYGEGFFTSLGFAPLPKTFWERSLFVKPRDRDVVCHASAWDVDQVDDLRIKMCIDITDENFRTIHHELGHNFYQRAYSTLSPLYRQSANDGFHEAVGDTIALSITPEYLHTIGLLPNVPPAENDVGYLLKMALDKIAFLPFGLLIDEWRWKVFSGQIQPAGYNKTWWEMRAKYQGVAPPEPRTEAAFDPGAKYHVAASVPYSRYFLAHILEFQFYRAMCQEAGFQGPLHRCSFYNNKQAGAKLNRMLEMGVSRPWPEALAALTGTKQMDASALMEYFAPLKKWLDEQNRANNVKPGW